MAPRTVFRNVALFVLALCICSEAEGKVKFFSSESGITPPQKGPSKVWLYTSVAADYDGALMLPHFIRHYMDLGIQPEHFLVVVNHNPEAKNLKTETPVEDVVAVLDSFGIKYHLWLDQYSSEKLYKIRLQLLNIVPLQDWIVHADSDELHEYGARDLVKYLNDMDKQGVNEIKGEYVDRVSKSGELTAIEASPGIFEQYPMKCQVIKNVAQGRDTKAMAYKGYWRTDRGNHQVLRPAKAMSYLGAPDKKGGVNRAVENAEDLWPLTPYARVPQAYQYVCAGADLENGKVVMKMPKGVKCHILTEKNKKAPLPRGWARKSNSALVHHFKWHAGVINSVKDRLKYYKGDVDKSGKAKYDWYQDSQKLLDGVVGEEKIDLKKNKCRR
mmetsp:Transcript_26307/g.31919  ORF Transcript_26307/g.31919 Transcript_26307/m.31919 type:complete len:385 (-) Transcript_26307:267-1421(-)